MKSILLVYLCILVYLFMVLLENRCACLAAYQILWLTRANAQTARERGGCSSLWGRLWTRDVKVVFQDNGVQVCDLHCCHRTKVPTSAQKTCRVEHRACSQAGQAGEHVAASHGSGSALLVAAVSVANFFFVTVVLLNLLIAMLSSTYETILQVRSRVFYPLSLSSPAKVGTELYF